MAAVEFLITLLLSVTMLSIMILVVFMLLARGSAMAIIKSKISKTPLLLYMDSKHFIQIKPFKYTSGIASTEGISGSWFVDPEKVFKLDGNVSAIMVCDALSFNINPFETLAVQKLMDKLNAISLQDLFKKLKDKKIIKASSINSIKDNSGIIKVPSHILDIDDKDGILDIPLKIEPINVGRFLKAIQLTPTVTATFVDSFITQEVSRRLKSKVVSLKPLITIGIFMMLIAIAVWVIGAAPAPAPQPPAGAEQTAQQPPFGLPFDLPIPGLKSGG